MATTGNDMLVGDTDEVSAREYLRVSYDRSGRERSNTEQQNDNRKTWPDFDFGEHYSDTVSASRYATKPRGDWKALTDDLAADRFGARVLVLWESSRGSRKVSDWVELAELCEQRGVLIAVTVHHRIYDPAIARDRRSLLDDAVDSEYESAKISARAKRAAAANAAAGRPNGQVPFGYRRLYDPVTRQLVAQEPEPEEAKVVLELFERIVAGHSLRSIAKDFNARGLRTRSGREWTGAHLRSVARRDLYRAKRAHTVGGFAMSGHEARKRNATLTEAIWPPIVPERLFLAVQRILADPSRRINQRAGYRPGRAVHWLSMIARCDVCSGPLQVTYRESSRGKRYPPQYQCTGHGHVRVDKAEIDDVAEQAIIGYLSAPANLSNMLADEGRDQALAAARLEVAQIRTELDDLAEQVGLGEHNGGISAMLAARAEPAILARLRAAEKREQELATPSALRGLIEPGDDVAERWDAAPISAKRRIARLLLVPGVIGELRVGRRPADYPQNRHQPGIERVVWRQTNNATTDDAPVTAAAAG